ncbi:MAG: C45 family peptidase [Candidatus Omnitrophota bacterium]|nr:C45 family peptidase [Candidatus Omnitrophota bacterium]
MEKLLCFLLLFYFIAGSGTGALAKNGNPTIATNEVILAKEPDTYLEIRHIVLRGSNEEIGKALGDIAQEWLGIKTLVHYAGPIYADARRQYMEKNYPILLERMKGVAKSYGLSPTDNTYVTSGLYYDIAPFGCSAAFFPASSTSNGHSLVGHNVDFHTATMREMLGMERVEGEHNLYSRNFVMELYPDKGYPSIVVGALDLLNGLQGGMNSEGLVVTMLSDDLSTPNTDPNPLGDDTGGLNALQLNRLILDTCATVDEAKVTILNNKLVVGFIPAHLQICDRSGKSFIFDTAPGNLSYHYTENNGQPQAITNHAVFLYPDASKFPSYTSKGTYNTFYRYVKLTDYIKGHQGKFSPDDVREAMSLAYAHTTDIAEWSVDPLPHRTLWTMLYDINERSIEVKFYLKDGPIDSSTGDPELVFTEPFKFKLKTTGNQ